MQLTEVRPKFQTNEPTVAEIKEPTVDEALRLFTEASAKYPIAFPKMAAFIALHYLKSEKKFPTKLAAELSLNKRAIEIITHAANTRHKQANAQREDQSRHIREITTHDVAEVVSKVFGMAEQYFKLSPEELQQIIDGNYTFLNLSNDSSRMPESNAELGQMIEEYIWEKTQPGWRRLLENIKKTLAPNKT